MAEATKSLDFGEQLSSERLRVDFDTYDMSVQQLISMVGQKLIDIAPSYQRKFRWKVERQSQLIESVFLGIPVPSLYMATNSNNSWEVVDGVQRLSTIIHFAGDQKTREAIGVSESLKIDGLEKLGTLNGKTFSDLPLSLQTQFNLRPIKTTTLNDKSDMKVRFDLFERLNTGGVRLTDQEIRGCIYRGGFNDFLERMAKDANFNKVVVLKDSTDDDGTREEYVLRFFAYLHEYKKFEHSVVEFLNDFMAEGSKQFDFQANEKTFKSTFAELAKIYPNGLHRRSKHTPVNLFEAVTVGAALTLKKNKTLSRRGSLVWINSDELNAMTTGATNSRKMVVGRIEYAAQKFGKV